MLISTSSSTKPSLVTPRLSKQSLLLLPPFEALLPKTPLAWSTLVRPWHPLSTVNPRRFMLGVAMLVCTYIYMYVWVHTAEINAKRIRERYLRAVLRQDIQFFDNVGAGEVATRIQTDTRKPTVTGFISSNVYDFRSIRSCPTRYF